MRIYSYYDKAFECFTNPVYEIMTEEEYSKNLKRFLKAANFKEDEKTLSEFSCRVSYCLGEFDEVSGSITFNKTELFDCGAYIESLKTTVEGDLA